MSGVDTDRVSKCGLSPQQEFLAMAISAELVKKLREATGAGMMECKVALEEDGG